MGWKFWGVVGSLPGLGRVITKAESIYLGKDEEDAAWLNKLHKWGDKIVLKILKYSPVKLSGPGDLELGSFSMVAWISNAVKGELRRKSCSDVIDGSLR